MKPNTRLKINKFIKKYGKLIGIVILVWLFILLLNNFLKRSQNEKKPTTTYTPHTAVLDSGSSTPKKVQNSIEKFVEEYVEHCNNKEYEKAYEMISEECKKNNFISFEDFKSYVNNKFNSKKIYSIQNYSNYNDKYIYSIKLYDDVLATGLTNSTYSFTSEKLTFYEGDDGLEMSAGNFIYYSDIKSISENEYLKIDVVGKTVNYSIESYEVKFTNRSNYTVVIADGQEENEAVLVLPNEVRNRSDASDLILEPQESITLNMVFPKFVDDGDVSQSLLFSSIRVMEKYSGTSEEVSEETIQSEIDNAISKFSMEVSMSQ